MVALGGDGSSGGHSGDDCSGGVGDGKDNGVGERSCCNCGNGDGVVGRSTGCGGSGGGGVHEAEIILGFC